MDWYSPKITKRGNGETGNGVRVSYGNEGSKGTVMYFYFLGAAHSPFALTNRMCITNPKNARIYFSDAEIEGVDGWKYIKDRKYGTPHISFTINDEKITETWKKAVSTNCVTIRITECTLSNVIPMALSLEGGKGSVQTSFAPTAVFQLPESGTAKS